MNPPLSLLTQHGAMYKGFARLAWQMLRPSTVKPTTAPTIERVLPAPSTTLVKNYVAWSGAVGRYQTTLPPHLVSQWGLPLVMELMLQTAYPMTQVINQGVSMRILGEIPQGQALCVRAAIKTQEEVNGVARVAVAVMTGTQQQPDLVEMTLHMAFLLPNHQKRKTERTETAQPAWQLAGTWQADSHDGFKFAVLTGDFNPIHWIGLAGKLSAFKSKVLHGFGMFVRSYECLDAVNIKEIDVRFLKPVKLPSHNLSVEHTAKEMTGWRSLRLVGQQGVVHLAGRYR